MAFMIMILISLSLPLIVGYILVSYIKSLEDKKCACSNDRRRKYIKYYGYFLIIFAILMLFTNLVFGLSYNNAVQSFLRIISFGVNFLAAYLLYSYSNLLEDSTCKCSESWRRTFLKFYGYFLGGIFSFISTCIIATFIFHICQGDDIVIRSIKA